MLPLRLLFSLAFLAAASAHAFEPAGTEFQANTYTSSFQDEPDVAGLGNGDFVVVWESGSYDVAQDGEYAGIYAQRFDEGGVRVGSEFRINAYTTDSQAAASVAPTSDGGFVVAWQSYGQDGAAYGIFARRLTAVGDPASGDFQVNTYTSFGQYYAEVAATPNGFIVVWESCEQDGSREGVFGQRYDASGNAVGSEFQVNTYTSGRQRLPEISADSAGNFVVVWESDPDDGATGQDGSDAGIFAQRFGANGLPNGTEFVVNAYTTDRQIRPVVNHTTGGGFVVAWEGRKDTGGAQVNDEISARVFDAAGTAVGTEFLVNQHTTGPQERPALARTSDGELLIVWESTGGIGATDTMSEGVFARRLTSQGELLGTEFQVNSFIVDDQEDVAVAGLASGGFVVAWESYLQDGDGQGVFGQAFADEMCGDATGDARYTASDALLTLRAAVGSSACLDCICDVNGSGGTNATDALIVLRVAVGQGIPLLCTPC